MTFTHNQLLSTYVVYQTDLLLFTIGKNFTLGKSLFGDIMVTKNADFDKYECYGYGIGYNARNAFCYLMTVDSVKLQ